MNISSSLHTIPLIHVEVGQRDPVGVALSSGWGVRGFCKKKLIFKPHVFRRKLPLEKKDKLSIVTKHVIQIPICLKLKVISNKTGRETGKKIFPIWREVNRKSFFHLHLHLLISLSVNHGKLDSLWSGTTGPCPCVLQPCSSTCTGTC